MIERQGRAQATSRDVAAMFGKRHDHVLRDIDTLLATAPDLSPNFEEMVEPVAIGSGATRQARIVYMTRDGFMLLAMGFTGAKAVRLKLRYIAAFNDMEAQLQRAPQDVAATLNDPASLRNLLLTYSDRVLALEHQNATLQPKALALERIAGVSGSLNLRESAKLLGRREREFISELQAKRIIYRRPGQAAWLGYADREQAGLLEHKHSTVERRDGSEKSVAQVRLTTKLLTRLAEQQAGGAGDLFQ